MERPRIVVAEDNSEMREKIKKLIAVAFNVVGSVTDGQQAVNSVLELNPHILVTDISMPILNGIQVASRLRDLGSCTKVILVTVHDDDDYREAAFSMGAVGYVLKSRIATDLAPAIQAALRGQIFSSNNSARHS